MKIPDDFGLRSAPSFTIRFEPKSGIPEHRHRSTRPRGSTHIVWNETPETTFLEIEGARGHRKRRWPLWEDLLMVKIFPWARPSAFAPSILVVEKINLELPWCGVCYHIACYVSRETGKYTSAVKLTKKGRILVKSRLCKRRVILRSGVLRGACIPS